MMRIARRPGLSARTNDSARMSRVVAFSSEPGVDCHHYFPNSSSPNRVGVCAESFSVGFHAKKVPAALSSR